MDAVQQIKQKGYVSRGMLGVMVQPLTDDMVKAFKLNSDAGAAVASVSPGSGADKAGLQAGDVILSFNGQSIDSAPDLPPLVSRTRPGSDAQLVILRAGKRQTVNVKIGELPRDEDAVGGSPATPQAKVGVNALGLTVQELDAASRKQLGLKPGEGVAVSNITGPVAARAGLNPGDVILMVNQRRVGSAAAFREAVAGAKPGDTVLLLVRRDDASSFIGLTIPSAGK